MKSDYAAELGLRNVFLENFNEEVLAHGDVYDEAVLARFMSLRFLYDNMWRTQVEKTQSMFSAITPNRFNSLPRWMDVMSALKYFFPEDISERVYNHAKAGTVGNDQADPLRDMLYAAISLDPEVIISYADQPFSYLTDLASLLWQKDDEDAGPWGVD